jgi:hypothetical protein
MLTFEEKLAIAESFSELQRKDVSLGRVNFHYEEGSTDKKNVVYHLHPNGNGFVYGKYLQGYATNDQNMVNIRDFSSEALHNIIQESIRSLSPKAIAEDTKEKWMNRDNHTLILLKEDDMWNIYAGSNLDGTFNTYREAGQYLDEEGFSLK